MELDRAVAREVGVPRQATSGPLADSYYAPDELEVLEDELTDPGRSRLVHASLRELGSELAAAVTASDHDDWTSALEAVRMIQGRAVVTRRALEGMLGSYPAGADLPPLVRAVQAVGRVISQREVDSLSPDELRVRMHAVLDALDRELQSFLEPPEDVPAPTNRDRDAPADGCSEREKP